MKRIYIFLQLLLSCSLLYAQTWNGSVNTDWNNASNWTPAGVPTSAGNVIIPGSVASNSWPVFTGNVTINSIDMQPGCRLDVNGFALTINGVNMNINFNGAIINNSNGATDIVFNINTGSNGFLSYFRSNTINDNIVFNLTGNNQFIEAVAAPVNVYNGNAVFNINDVLTTYISYGVPSEFNGDLTVNRTVAGPTSLFYAGATITGNFTYTNNTSSAVSIGNLSFKTAITGTVNITNKNTSTAPFAMYRVVNQTTGGTIDVQNSQGFNLQNDTLLVTTLSITGYRGSQYANLMNNSITGNVTVADDASYGGGFLTYIRNNVITGNSSFSNNGSNVFAEADVIGSGNIYNGNVTFNAASGSSVLIGYGAQLQCTGNLTINRTATGLTSAFSAGAIIGGNFTYTNNTAGETGIGNLANKTSVGGTINITANFTTPNYFGMHRLVNQTNGGSITVTNSLGFSLQNDTLLLTEMNITGYKGGQYAYLFNNAITGNVTIADDASFSGGFTTNIRNNTINGNSSFTISGTNAFAEADGADYGNRYNGNLTFNCAGNGNVFISYLDTTQCTGNLTINRTAAGLTSAFNSGAVIGGNFTFTNNTAGETGFGNLANKTSIGGLINITANFTTPNNFGMHRLVNQTNGGSITVTNSLGFSVLNDTLLLSEVNITGYKGGQYAYLFNNAITGNVTIADDASFSGGFTTNIRNNTINGNSSFTISGINAFAEADGVGFANRYNGNVNFTGAGPASMFIAYLDTLHCTGNVNISRTAAGQTLAFNAGATINGNFTYTNNTAGKAGFGNLAYKTSIGGLINITANFTSPNNFGMHRLVNQTNGGSITVTNSLGFSVQNDTLLLTTMSITGYKGGQFGYFYNNAITGNVSIANDITYAGGYYTYLRSNIITGNTSIANNGSNVLFDADQAGTGNKYLGNVTYIKTGAGVSVGAGDVVEISGNLTLNSTDGIGLGKIKFNGSTASVIEQLSTQPINIAELIIDKTASGTVTLNDSVSINTSTSFISGIINSSTGKEFIFLDNTSYTGASNTSFVNGPCKKTGNDAFIFPVGKNGVLASIGISAPGIGTDVFMAQYFYSRPHDDGYDSTLKDQSLHHISKNEYWLLDRIEGTSNVFVTLSWESNIRSGLVNNMPELRVARWNGSMWKDEGNGGTTGSNTAGTILSLAAVSNFSPFTLASSSVSNPLPVNFILFNVSLRGNNTVLLTWKTSDGGINNARFEVERSTDGRNWMRLSVVQPQPSHEYEYMDNSVTDGIYFYRIKQVDVDGAYKYSIVNMIRMNRDNKILVWPNPVTENLFVQTPFAKGSMDIIDLSGRIIRKQIINSSVTTVPVQQLSKGVYFIRIRLQDEVFTTRFIKE
ncbi:MAG: T9SS type A sorting domain-containing protein [Chitinophagaceae bacterium]|nr:T9SS type A sorting domain-containing protein [Chitinophagaceae bacterium]